MANPRTDLERVKRWLAQGRILSPSGPGFVDLVHALARLGGYGGLGSGPGVDALCRTIGAAPHTAFVLVDGLGRDLLRHLPAASFLRRHVRGILRAVFPSTTAAALTTLATGRWPAVHGAVGWWIRLAGRDLSAVTLRFCERHSERLLTTFGVPLEEVFPVPSFWSRLGNRALCLLPEAIAGSPYSRYACGNGLVRAYCDLEEAFDKTCRAALEGPERGITYLYLPQLDGLCHDLGTTHPKVSALLEEIDQRVEHLAGLLKGRGRVLVCGDHGEVDVPAERRYILAAEDPLVSTLVCFPTGEPRVPLFHVQAGQEGTFKRAFQARFGNDFALLGTEEVSRLRLLGPEYPSEWTRMRMGSFLALAPQATVFYIESGKEEGAGNRAFHGGLTPAEMEIPLIVA